MKEKIKQVREGEYYVHWREKKEEMREEGREMKRKRLQIIK